MKGKKIIQVIDMGVLTSPIYYCIELILEMAKPQSITVEALKSIQIRGAAQANLPSRTIDLTLPTDYQAKVKKAWSLYNTDPLFRFLINRTTEYAVNGMEWIVEDESEKELWSSWAARINRGVPNCLPGLDEVTSWIIKHLQLSGICHLHWFWDKIELGEKKQKHEFPAMMATENPLSVVLQRSAEMDSEKILLKRPTDKKEPLKEGSQPSASQTMQKGQEGVDEIPAMGFGKKEEMFSIKLNYSHGDLTTTLTSTNENTGQALYPEPPFLTLNSAISKRQLLDAADIAVLDGIQNYIMLWQIGDDKNPPLPDKKDSQGNIVKEGTIRQVKKILEGDENTRTKEAFVPYYVDLKILTPPFETLLSLEKYTQPTLEIMEAFGILMSVGGAGAERFLEINISNFEERIDFLRKRCIKRFFETLASYIAERNGFKSTPKLSFAPINTKSDKFISNLLEMSKLGKISSRTMHEFTGIDHDVEKARIINEVDSGLKEKMDENTPVSYKQTVTGPDGKTKETDVTPTKQKGRPKNS